MFPDQWGQQQLLEELAYAFDNIEFWEYNKWTGTLRNGHTCTFVIKGLKKDKIIKSITRIITVWPD